MKPEKFTEQGALTIVAELIPDKIEWLRTLLEKEVELDPGSNAHIPFARLSGVHYARILILDEARDLKGLTLPPKLVFNTNYDAPLESHLRELTTLPVVYEGLCRIFSACRDFPANPTQDSLLAFIQSHSVRYEALHIGNRGRSLSQIKNEASLREGLEKFLDERIANGTLPKDSDAIQKEVREFARQGGEKWRARPPVILPYAGELWRFFILAGLVVILPLVVFKGTAFWVLLGILAVVIVFSVLWAVAFRMKELADDAKPVVPFRNWAKNEQEQLRFEDQIAQSQLTHLVNIKPGLIRGLTLRLVLRGINLLGRYWFNKGSFSGIPTIHFASFVIIDEGRRLLFFSNFDASWENYLGDFIDKGTWGLTGMWSNTMNFPKTKWLFWEGATHAQEFKDWTHAHQVPTRVWYPAYKTLTVRNINQNSEIRDGLHSTVDLLKL